MTAVRLQTGGGGGASNIPDLPLGGCMQTAEERETQLQACTHTPTTKTHPHASTCLHIHHHLHPTPPLLPSPKAPHTVL